MEIGKLYLYRFQKHSPYTLAKCVDKCGTIVCLVKPNDLIGEWIDSDEITFQEFKPEKNNTP